MDEFLYILFLVGWLAFSVYQQSQKKKRKEALKQAADQQQADEGQAAQQEERSGNYTVVPEEKVQKKTDFRKTLEELLLGEEVSLETIPEEEAQSLEIIPEKEYVKENKYQKYSQEKLVEKWDEFERKNEVVLKEDDKDKRALEHHFDLRNAVIYAEILNRKYVN